MTVLREAYGITALRCGRLRPRVPPPRSRAGTVPESTRGETALPGNHWSRDVPRTGHPLGYSLYSQPAGESYVRARESSHGTGRHFAACGNHILSCSGLSTVISRATLTGFCRVPVGKRPFGESRGRLGMTVLREAYGITAGLLRDYDGMSPYTSPT